MTIDKLLQTDKPIYETGFNNTDLLIAGQVKTKTPTAQASKYEVNIYSFNGILLESYIQNNTVPFREPSIGESAGKYLDINLSTYFDQSNLNSGKYYYIVNSYNTVMERLVVEEISSTRTEIRLLRVKEKDEFLVKNEDRISLAPNEEAPSAGLILDAQSTTTQATTKTILTDFDKNLVYRNTKPFQFRNLFLNFGQNRLFRIINIEFGKSPSFEVLVKLYEPLPIDIDIKQLCQLDEVYFSYGDVAEYIQNVEIVDPTIQIKGPNFNIDVDFYKNSTTGFQTWNDLLDVNLSTSQQIIDSYFGESLQGIKLNIDYSKPEQFVFYSSAEERFNNFYYKIQLIEDYNKQLTTLNNINQSIKSSNIIDVAKKRNKIITGFDDFEKYLYFGTESGSLYTFYTGSIATWPKTTTGSLNWLEAYNFWVDTYSTGSLNTNIGYNLQSTTSTIVKTYAEDTIAILREYDKNNISSLLKTVPASSLLDESNSEYFVFVNMIGHHFDIIYTYINHLSSIHSREEHPLDGISKGLLTDVADSFGWKLVNSKKKDSLWRYVTGLNSDGNYLQTGSLTPTISTEQYTLEIWNRIVNNLPYLLKTKGTKRSI